MRNPPCVTSLVPQEKTQLELGDSVVLLNTNNIQVSHSCPPTASCPLHSTVLFNTDHFQLSVVVSVMV